MVCGPLESNADWIRRREQITGAKDECPQCLLIYSGRFRRVVGWGGQQSRICQTCYRRLHPDVDSKDLSPWIRPSANVPKKRRKRKRVKSEKRRCPAKIAKLVAASIETAPLSVLVDALEQLQGDQVHVQAAETRALPVPIAVVVSHMNSLPPPSPLPLPSAAAAAVAIAPATPVKKRKLMPPWSFMKY